MYIHLKNFSHLSLTAFFYTIHVHVHIICTVWAFSGRDISDFTAGQSSNTERYWIHFKPQSHLIAIDRE